MHRAIPPALALMLALGASAPASAAASTDVALDRAALSPEECAVWQRELSFAQSVADHDAAAFAAHVHPGAAFGASRPVPTRGREAITMRWNGIIQGKAVALAWYPTRVTIGGAGDIAWSSGPSLLEDRDPDAKVRYSLGGFHSVWHRGADGIWRVLFDDGIEQKPVTPVEVEAFHAGRSTACPKG